MADVIPIHATSMHALSLATLEHQGDTIITRTWAAGCRENCGRCLKCSARPADPGHPERAWACTIVVAGIVAVDARADAGDLSDPAEGLAGGRVGGDRVQHVGG